MRRLTEYETGYIYGFLGAIAAIYIVRVYFPGMFNRVIIVKHDERVTDAATDASERVAQGDEIRADA
ncbi:MAG: hypothetical protein ACYDCE_16240 [Candidatus Acidiferrales bacterium]